MCTGCASASSRPASGSAPCAGWATCSTPKAMRLRSLLLRWLLVPLALLSLVGFAIQYVRSVGQVNAAYDRTLLGSALVMAERATVRGGELAGDVPYAALEM